MHWLALIMYALLYALVGMVIGASYALFTGADQSSLGSVVGVGVVFGPVIVLVIAAFRKLARDTGFQIPIARVIYHTILISFAAPVLLYGAQLVAGAFDAPKVARSFEVLKYWSIPSVFITAVMYSIWRLVRHEERIHTRGASGSPGSPSGTLPPGSSDPGPRAARGGQRRTRTGERHANGRLLQQPRHPLPLGAASGSEPHRPRAVSIRHRTFHEASDHHGPRPLLFQNPLDHPTPPSIHLEKFLPVNLSNYPTFYDRKKWDSMRY